MKGKQPVLYLALIYLYSGSRFFSSLSHWVSCLHSTVLCVRLPLSFDVALDVQDKAFDLLFIWKRCTTVSIFQDGCFSELAFTYSCEMLFMTWVGDLTGDSEQCCHHSSVLIWLPEPSNVLGSILMLATLRNNYTNSLKWQL